jgi:predicted nucleic acid-binding protein
MSEYLLDTNVIIKIWEFNSSIIDKIIKFNKIKVLKEVLQELAIKERQNYKGQQVLSERFCKLLSFIMEVDTKKIAEFYSLLDLKFSEKGNAYFRGTEKLSENDLILLYACHLHSNLILVTEDKYLFKAVSDLLGRDRVISLKTLIERAVDGQINLL